MISLSGKKWEQKKINQNLVDKLKQDYNFNDILSRLIISRKFDDDEIATINTDLDLNNVFKNNEDFNQSVKLVVNCINNNEKICILGDYDVDGSAATSLFVKFLESINHSFFYYIPDREKDGYGATKKLFKKLILERNVLVTSEQEDNQKLENYLNDIPNIWNNVQADIYKDEMDNDLNSTPLIMQASSWRKHITPSFLIPNSLRSVDGTARGEIIKPPYVEER